MAFYKVCGNYYGTDNDANSLKHYRTPGSKNGVRKYQYEDGTLTPAGKIHYGVGKGSAAKTATAYTDTGTGSGGPKGAAGLAYRLGGAQGYNNYRNAERGVRRWGDQAVSDVRNYANLGATRGSIDAAKSDALTNTRAAKRDVDYLRSRLTEDNDKRIRDNDLINKQRADKQFGPSQQYADQFNENTRINYVENQRRLAEAGRNARAVEAEGERQVREAEEAYNKSVNKSVDDAKKWVSERASDAKNWTEQAAKDVGKAASDVKKWGDQAGKDIGKAASDVKTWGEQAAKDVGKAAKDVGNAVGTAAKNVGNAVGKAAKDVGDWGKGAVDKGRDFITGLFGKKKKG